jgi:predicted PurR-regulated permease PerM
VLDPETSTSATPKGVTGLTTRLRQRVFAGNSTAKVITPRYDITRPLPSHVIDEHEEVHTHADLQQEAAKWNRRRDIPIAVLAWAGVLYLLLIIAQHVATTLLLLVIAAILAFALAPAVTFLQRWLPRVVAILIVYLLVLGGVGTLIYLIALTAVAQVNSAVTYLSSHNLSSFLDMLTPFGITKAQLQTQIHSMQGQLVDQAKNLAGSAVPLLAGFFDALLNIVLVAVLSIYFLIDGERIVKWLRRNAPRSVRQQTRLTLDTINHVVGGYIRGQLFLCGLIGLLVGVGMTILGVPYALLLGVLAFFLEFIPILGTLVSGAICVLLGLTHGWLIGVIVLIYFIGVHILEGDIIGPRIVGKAIGLHPIVSIAALIAGSELFGVWGALFASPVAGVFQALLVVIWLNWRARHPQEFRSGAAQPLDSALGEFVEQTQRHHNKPSS